MHHPQRDERCQRHRRYHQHDVPRRLRPSSCLACRRTHGDPTQRNRRQGRDERSKPVELAELLEYLHEIRSEWRTDRIAWPASAPQLAEYRPDDEPDPASQAEPRSQPTAEPICAWREDKAAEEHNNTGQDVQPQPVERDNPRVESSEGLTEIWPDQGDQGTPQAQQCEERAAYCTPGSRHHQRRPLLAVRPATVR